MSQTFAPLLAALQAAAARPHTAFYTPGHKLGQGAPADFATAVGAAALRHDLPELPDIGGLFEADGPVQAAQDLAAEAFGAGRTWFLANGSTCGIEAAILATCNPGDKIVLPRNAHQSAIAGLILSGAQPIFVQPELDAELDIAHVVSPATVAAALAEHPDAKAVLAISPTYYGVCGDVATLADLAHQFGIPLIVDEAHGPHFAFHPDLPTSALAAGADIVVQSTHKVLAAMTQAAMLHVSHAAIDRKTVDCDRINQALQWVQSTSPNYLLLASLDAARQQMALEGEALMAQTLELSWQARRRIAQIPGLSVLDVATSQGGTRDPSPGFQALDPTRLTVTVSGLGLSGFEADTILSELGAIVELPSHRHVTTIISLGNTAADIDRFVAALTILAEQHAVSREVTDVPRADLLLPPLPLQSALSPRQAFSSTVEVRSRQQAIGRISAELVCPYPPGIPILLPGEVISAAALDYLEAVLQLGGEISGCADPSLQTLRVVCEGASGLTTNKTTN